MTFVTLEARVGRWAMLSNVFWFETVEAKPLCEYKITFVGSCLFFEVSANMPSLVLSYYGQDIWSEHLLRRLILVLERFQMGWS